MGILADQVDYVIGVDTHRDAHSAAIVTAPTGAVTNIDAIRADAFGNKRVLRFATLHAPGRRVWAIESSGSYGSGLTTFLLERGEWVVEIDRPGRPATRNGAKSDELDAVRAAREALTRDHLAQPRRRGDREALRVLLITRRSAIRARTKAINHLKALVVTSREEIRHQLRRHDTRHDTDLVIASLRAAEDPRDPVGRAPRHDHGAARDRSSHHAARGRSQRPRVRDPAVDQDQRSMAARRGRYRADHRRAADLLLVTSGAYPQRRRVRDARWRSTHPRVLRADHPIPPQPRR